MKEIAIGIDLGGTNCRVGIVSPKGKILKQEIFPIGRDRSPKSIINILKNAVTTVREYESTRVRGIGIGAPGIVDFENGIIIRSPHYPGWHNFKLRDELSKAVKLPVILDNDANIIAAGELWKGAGKGLKNFIMVTLGTGIGGGIVIDGRVFHGDFGFAGEIGHQIIQFDGETCDCGGRGCWENYVSIGGLRWLIVGDERFNGDIEKVTPRNLFELAKEGDIFASAIWKKFGAYLGAGLASLANVTGILSFVIGGGISGAWDFFITETKKEFGRRTYKETAERAVIKRAELGDSAGIIGAVSSVLS